MTQQQDRDEGVKSQEKEEKLETEGSSPMRMNTIEYLIQKLGINTQL